MSDVPCIVHFDHPEQGVEVTVGRGRILLEVAEEAGVFIDSLCRGGSCGTCRVRLQSGTVSIESLKTLDPSERAAGWILACSARTIPGQRVSLALP